MVSRAHACEHGGADIVWAQLLGGNPVRWLLDCGEPAARWVTLTAVLDRDSGDPDVQDAHRDVVADPATKNLAARLPDWTSGDRLSGHNNPSFAPNLLNLLADMGVGAGDFEETERLLDAMLAHQEPSGRFPSYGAIRGTEEPVWGALLCDSHAVLEVLVRFGREHDAGVESGLRRMAADITGTAQGRAWPCLPHSTQGWRGPGRKNDFCPMVTLQALRTFARVPPHLQPGGLLDVARVALRAWRVRAMEKPYMFGHGRQFKTVKWPPTWYGAYAVLDALGRYPKLWRAADSDPADARAVAELAACLVAYNVSADGTVTPRSTYRGFEAWSFGQKKQPSPFATALLLAVLHRIDDLAPAAADVDVRALTSSKGGHGLAVPPPDRATRAAQLHRRHQRPW
ncbi:MAG: hypothetical protein ACM3ML_15750 [Micromonosporaceae bacterium]